MINTANIKHYLTAFMGYYLNTSSNLAQYHEQQLINAEIKLGLRQQNGENVPAKQYKETQQEIEKEAINNKKELKEAICDDTITLIDGGKITLLEALKSYLNYRAPKEEVLGTSYQNKDLTTKDRQSKKTTKEQPPYQRKPEQTNQKSFSKPVSNVTTPDATTFFPPTEEQSRKL